MVMLPVTLVWARLLAVPLHLSADYAPDAFVPSATITVAHVAAAMLLVAALVTVWRLRRRAPALAFGAAWFAVTVAIGTNVVFPTGVLFAERLLYLPSVGAALAVGALWEMVPRHRFAWPAAAAALALLAARSLERVPVWRTPQRFLTARIADAPASYRTHWQVAAWAFEHGDPRGGERELLEAARIWPSDPELLEEIGARYLGAGVLGPADRFSSAAYALDPTRGSAAAQAIVARLRQGSLDSADALARRALRRTPSSQVVALAAIAVFDRRGDLPRVLAVARRYGIDDPENGAFPLIAADAASRLGRCAEARSRLEGAYASARGDAARAEVRRRLDGLARCGRGR
jgi:hypothetical protein